MQRYTETFYRPSVEENAETLLEEESSDSYSQLVWQRFSRSKAAIVGGLMMRYAGCAGDLARVLLALQPLRDSAKRFLYAADPDSLH